jgi:hypothetical protein
MKELAVKLPRIGRRFDLLKRVACGKDRDLGSAQPHELPRGRLRLREVAVGLVRELERWRKALLDSGNPSEVGVHGVAPFALPGRTTPGENESGEENDADGRPAHLRYFSSSTVETLPSP